MAGMLKLSPFYSEKVWVYEKWNLSTHKNGYSGIEDSDDNLIDVIGKELPILIKVICANENLSVQYGGIKVVEVQQSSDVTYRMYDWGRDREMHIENDLDFIDYNGINSSGKMDDFEKL